MNLSLSSHITVFTCMAPNKLNQKSYFQCRRLNYFGERCSTVDCCYFVVLNRVIIYLR